MSCLKPLSSNKSLKDLCERVTKELRARGILVAIQNSVSTSSIYVKFDHGMLRSLRIGDHYGKAKYKYGYEIGPHIKTRNDFFSTIEGQPFIRVRFPFDQIDDLITEIRLERSNKRAKYTPELYEMYKKQNIER